MERDSEGDRLQAREADLAGRERRAAADPADAAVLAGLAEERDALADAYDDEADGRDAAAHVRRARAEAGTSPQASGTGAATKSKTATTLASRTGSCLPATWMRPPAIAPTP